MPPKNLTKSGFERVSAEVEVNGKTCIIAIDEYRGMTSLSARFMYTGSDGELKHSGNGINIRIDGEDGMEAAIIITEAMQHTLSLTAQHNTKE